MRIQLLMLFIGLPAISLAQIHSARQPLAGKIVADSLDVDNITITNKSTNSIAISNERGKFTINAAEKDTLEFSSIAFDPRTIIVAADDFDGFFTVRLQRSINNLDEVKIYRTRLPSDLAAASKSIKTVSAGIPSSAYIMKNIDPEPELKNEAMPSSESSLQGMDLLEIGGMLFGWIGKKKEDKPKPFTTDKLFADVVQQRFTYYFFTQTLQIERENIGLFLAFCDTPNAKSLLDPLKELELTEYLVVKATEFKNLK